MAEHNTKLRAVREATPSRWFPGRAMTRSELAQLVVEHVWFHERVEVPLDRKYIAKLELGVIRHPTARYRRALRDVLHARTDLELGFISPNRARAAGRLPPGVQAAPPCELTAQHLGDLLIGAAGAGTGTLGLVDRLWREDGPVAHPDITERARELARLDLVVEALGAVAASGDRRDRAELARVAAHTEAVGRLLLAAVADRCQTAALAALDRNEVDRATRYVVVGVRAAHLAANDRFAAHLFSLLACGSPADPDRPAPTAGADPPLGAGDAEEIVKWATHLVGNARVRSSCGDRPVMTPLPASTTAAAR